MIKAIPDTVSIFSDPLIDTPGKVFKNLYQLEYDASNPTHKALYRSLIVFFNDMEKVCSLQHLTSELHIGITLTVSPLIKQLREEQKTTESS